MCICVAILSLSYCIGLLIQDYFWHSMLMSIYFIGVDFVLNYLICFLFIYTSADMKQKKMTVFLRAIEIYAAVEGIAFLINPFKEFIISYTFTAEESISYYGMDMMAPYYLHLIYTYLMVVVALIILIYKAIRVPFEYRMQYILCSSLLIIIVALNAVFLYLPLSGFMESIDVSIIIYAITIVAFYICCFRITRQQYFKSYQGTVLKNINQGIVVFDYEDFLIMANDKAKSFIRDSIDLHNDLKLDEFLETFYISKNEFYDKENYSLQVYHGDKEKALPLRFDYKKLHSASRKKEDIGRMFVISDVALETDLLTGYHRWSNFLNFYKSEPDVFPAPCVITVCDINALSLINNLHGKTFGDKVIKDLADSLRDIFDADSYYVRGNEANLIIISRSFSLAEANKKLESFKENYKVSIQYAVGATSSQNPDVVKMIESTVNAMKNRKIMDKDSAHSAILTSLIRALQECDSDTEAHVKRTQIIGRKFAKRLKLSDNEISQLELLCVLHDIGKIGIPLEILNKPGKLNDDEWKLMETHVEKGYKIAASSADFAPIADLILHHHERWDGKGYPSGLSKETIPLLSRIISVIDAYDAMISVRPYKSAMSHDAARLELAKNAGTQFDPRIVSEFLLMLHEDGDQIHEAASRYDNTAGTQSSPDIEKEADSISDDAAADTGSDVLEGTVDSSTPHNNVQHTGAAIYPMYYCRYVLDSADYRIIYADESFTKLTGYTQEDITELKLTQNSLIPAEDITNYLIKVQEQLANNSLAYIEHRLLCKNGEIKYVFCMGRQYYDSANKASRAEILVVDSSSTMAVQLHTRNAQERAHRQLQKWEQTYRKDSMTNLLNHGAFVDDVEALLIKGSNIALIILDVDNFKKYNDTFGHRAGDELLIVLAQSLQSAVGRDGLVCRLGGDEFAAIVPYNKVIFEDHDNSDEIKEKLKRIFDQVNGSVRHINNNHSISMGIVFSGNENTTFSKLYDCADSALYASKQAGRSRCTFYNEPD